MDMRAAMLARGLEVFDALGLECATMADVLHAMRIPEGAEHDFQSKDELAAAIHLEALRDYHRAMLAPLTPELSARRGIEELITAHLNWIVTQRAQAKFLHDHDRAEWLERIREEHAMINASFGARIQAWRAPHVASGALYPMSAMMFHAQLTGPMQVCCSVWLSGRSKLDPRRYGRDLIDCALHALVADEAVASQRMSNAA